MTRAEWDQVVAAIAANWPGNPPPDASIEKWFSDLEDLNGAQVLIAVETLYRDGREFPPNGAQIRAKLLDLSVDELDDGEAWELVRAAGKKFGLDGDWREALEFVEEHSVIVAIAARRFGVGSLFAYKLENETAARAQFRDIYRGAVERESAGRRYAGLPSAGLVRLDGSDRSETTEERLLPSGNRHSGYRHLRKAGSAASAFSKAIAPGDAA